LADGIPSSDWRYAPRQFVVMREPERRDGKDKDIKDDFLHLNDAAHLPLLQALSRDQS
jgi:hypothetical protein